MIYFKYLTYFILILNNFVQSYKFTSTLPPKIGLSSWMTVEKSRDGNGGEWERGSITPLLVSGVVNVERNPNGTTVIISPHLDKVRIVCNASYPVRWFSPQSEYRPDDLYSYQFYIYETRYAKNVRDPRTFIYQSTLEIEDSSSGVARNFYCKSLSDPRMQRSLYIFWEGTTYLQYAGEVIDVRTMDNKTIVLPCTVTRPDVMVYLFKEDDSGDIELQRNDSIRYEPHIGFTLVLKNLTNVYGRYRCNSEDQEESSENEERSVRLNVLHGFHQDFNKKEIVFNETIKANATFVYDVEGGKFICCSSSAKPPNLKVIYCHDRIVCKTKEQFLYKISSGHAKNTGNGSCTTYEVYRKNSGILRCRGDDIDVFKMYFTGILNPFSENDTIKVYYSLTDVNEEELVNVIQSDMFVPIYAYQNFSAFCDASEFYFSKGIHWAVKWKNNSLQFLEESYNPYFDEKYSYGRGADFNTVVVRAEPGMESLICYAPVWNSTEWITKETPMVVKESKIPSVYIVDTDKLYWKLNETDKIITCIATGDPIPYVHWRKDNKTILMSETNLELITFYENGTSILSIPRVSHETQGEYICTGINFAGEDQKYVWVYVSNPIQPSTTAGLVIFISTVVCFCLLLGIFLLIWKLKLQKNIIDHLAGVVFRDVGK